MAVAALKLMGFTAIVLSTVNFDPARSESGRDL
jgi:hypothetical protein